MEEIFKPIIGYESYEASNLGNIRVIEGFYVDRCNKTRFRKGRVLSKTKDVKGYFRVNVGKDGLVRETKKVHRLVAIAFILNTESKPHINHIDGVKTNNHVSNLEWVTAKENNIHAIKNNLKKSQKGIRKIKKVNNLFNNISK